MSFQYILTPVTHSEDGPEDVVVVQGCHNEMVQRELLDACNDQSTWWVVFLASEIAIMTQCSIIDKIFSSERYFAPEDHQCSLVITYSPNPVLGKPAHGVAQMEKGIEQYKSGRVRHHRHAHHKQQPVVPDPLPRRRVQGNKHPLRKWNFYVP